MLERFLEALKELLVPMQGNIFSLSTEHVDLEEQPLDVISDVVVGRLGLFEFGAEFLNCFVKVFFLHISSPSCIGPWHDRASLSMALLRLWVVSNPREPPQGAEYQVAAETHDKDSECQSEMRAFEMIRHERAEPCSYEQCCRYNEGRF